MYATRTRLSRRAALRRGLLGVAALAGPGLLAACGTSSASNATVTASTPVASGTASTAATTVTTQSKTQAVSATATAASGPVNKAAATLTVASFYAFNQLSGWDGVLKVYHQTHPNVSIVPQATPAAQYVPKVLAQFASGTAPDVVGANNVTFIFQFVQNKVLEGLSPYFAKTAGFSTTDFFPHLMQRFTIKGTPYGVPNDNSPLGCLYYSPPIFQQAGVATPTETWTWPDAQQTAAKLTKRNGDKVTLYGVDSIQGIGPFIYAFGGTYADDVTNPTKCTLDNPKSMQGAQFYVDLMYKDKVTPSPTDVSASGATNADLYTAGKIAMTLGQFGAAVLTPEPYVARGTKVVLGPTGPTGTRKYGTGGTAYCITANSKVKDVAWPFITVWMGLPGHQAQYEAAKVPGATFPPAHIPSFDWYAKQPNFLGENFAADIRTADQYVTFDPGGANWAEVNTKVIAPGLDLIVRQKQPVSSMKDIASKATAMLQQLNKSTT